MFGDTGIKFIIGDLFEHPVHDKPVREAKP